MELNRATIRGTSYNLDVKWTEQLFCSMWQKNKKHLATKMKDRDGEMRKDWDELQKFLPKPKEQKRKDAE